MAEVKVKVLVDTVWEKKAVAAGKTLEIPEEVAELNPSIFEVVKEKKTAEKVPGES